MIYATPDGGQVTFESLWVTRFENKVPINEMDDEHLLNTIDYLENRANSGDLGADIRIFGTDLPRTQHNVEVLKRELIRRSE